LRLAYFNIIMSYYNSPPAWGLGKGLVTPPYKKLACYKMLHKVLEVAGSCEHSTEPSGSIKVGNFLINRVTISFSRTTLLHRVHHNT
jgi:hypothetical protein